MERAAYSLMASHEDRHWWFTGRRAVIGALLDRLDLPASPLILEAGCGTGGNLGMLERRGHVSAFEPFDEATESARDRNPRADVRMGRLPDDLPFAESSFDLVAALDVLEHCDDDSACLEALVRLVKPGGYVLVTVPAHQRLWGSHDRRLHHRRRYGRAELRTLARGAGAEIEFETAFNTVLAPIAVVYRALENLVGIELGNQERMPTPVVNRILGGLFGLERQWIARAAVPFGLSYGFILRRPLVEQH